MSLRLALFGCTAAASAYAVGRPHAVSSSSILYGESKRKCSISIYYQYLDGGAVVSLTAYVDAYLSVTTAATY